MTGGRGAPLKRCTVAFALRDRQYLWSLELPPDACIADALAVARAQAPAALVTQVPWDSAPVGVFGELRTRSQTFADGDRIEIYRPLGGDPRERRRARVERERRNRKKQAPG